MYIKGIRGSFHLINEKSYNEDTSDYKELLQYIGTELKNKRTGLIVKLIDITIDKEPIFEIIAYGFAHCDTYSISLKSKELDIDIYKFDLLLDYNVNTPICKLSQLYWEF